MSLPLTLNQGRRMPGSVEPLDAAVRDRCGLRLGGTAVEVTHHNGGPCACEHLCDGAPNACASTAHDRRLPIKPELVWIERA